MFALKKKMAMRNRLADFFCVFGRYVDYGIVLALLIGVVAAWPFLAYDSLPTATDAELHIFRIAEVGYSLKAGNPYPRWAANFYHGYGYPIFNYYAPLTYHLGNWLTLFHPERAVAGAKAIFVGSALLGAVGAYLLGREFGGRGGGVLGAAVFAFSPYIMLINPHVRGDLAEVLGLAWVPWTLWSWERLWDDGGKGTFIAAVFTASATLLSHNLTGLTMLILLVALSVWHWLIEGCGNRFGWALLAGLLTAALTAYFWLPFLLERQYIHLNVAGEGHYDFRNHFVLLKELLAPLRRLDWRATTTNPPMTAGPFSLLLAVAGLATTVRQRPRLRQLLFYALAALFCLWLITTGSYPLWEKVPGMQFYQFPWRFLGPLAALLVPMAASLGKIELPAKPYAALLSGCLGLLFLITLPGLYPIPWTSDFGPVTPLTLIEAELRGRWRGTTSTNDFVPATVVMIPGPQPSLLNSYYHPPVDRVNRYTLPEDVSVTILDDVPWHNTFITRAPKKFLLRLYLFHFPGWKAYVDGQEVPIKIANPEGFITVWVPEGEHRVMVRFEDTPPRRCGWIIAGVGGVILLLALWRFPRTSEKSPETPPTSADQTTLMWLAICLGCGVLLKGLVFDPAGWFHYTSPPGEAYAARYRQKADFGGEIALLGFDVSSTRLRPGDTLDISVYWNAERPMTETYQSFVHLVYPEGQIRAQSDHLNPAGFPTNLWPTDRYIKDQHRLVLPPDAPAGEYAISVGIYLLHTNQRLPVLWAESGARADTVILDQKIIVRDAH